MKRFGEAEKKVTDLQGVETSHKSNFAKQKTDNTKLKEDGGKLVTNLDTREMWLEVYRAVNECLPRDVGDQQDSEDITQKNRMNIKGITAKKYADVAKWYDEMKAKQQVFDTMSPADRDKGPAGSGYVFTLVGEHYRDDKNDDSKQGLAFVQSTLVKNLSLFELAQPGTPQPVPIRRAGLSHACVTSNKRVPNLKYSPRGKKTAAGASKTAIGGLARPPMGGNPMPTGKNPDGSKKEGEPSDEKIISRLDFTVQFCWTPTPSEKRLAEDPLKPVVAAAGANPTDPNAVAAPQNPPPAAVPGSAPTPAATTTPNAAAPSK